MNNRYFILRHGQSHANVAGIILSHLEDGKKDEYTLTEQGEADVRASVQKAKEQRLLGPEVIIISSPFSRCRRTAEIAKDVLSVQTDIRFDDRLRERWFGDWEKTSNQHYPHVWADDQHDPNHTIKQVESAYDVQQRTMELIQDLEKQHQGMYLLLVSHGDALQILQTGLQQQSAALHRELPHLETAEIRELEHHSTA